MNRFRVLPAMLALSVLLSGCGHLLVTEYTSVTPHTEQQTASRDEETLTAENYLSLKNAILSFVEDSVEEGVIRVYDYSGDVEEDLTSAVYEVSREDPLGAYAVETMTHDCALIVSYYEIRIHIQFRRTPEQIASVQRVSSMSALQEQLEQSMEAYDDALTARLSYYNGEDIEAMAREYYRTHPATVMEMPQVTVNIYPNSGYVRIIEVLFQYTHTPEELTEYRNAAETSVHAAQEYVRYRDTETDKLQLLYTYLQERFAYKAGSTVTPAYSFLCEGIADSAGCARSLQMICDEMELECYTVEGIRDGQTYYWNIVNVDGVYCHADLYRSLMGGSDSLTLYKDASMNGYLWDTEAYPACP